MKLGILSDLHLRPTGMQPRPRVDADVMVLAGDISVGKAGIAWSRATFSCPVIYVPGNHEYYGRNIDTLDVELRQACAGSQVHVLQNDVIVIDGVRFVGCTLWTDFALYGDAQGHAAEAWLSLNDYRVITSDRGGAIKPSEILQRHQASIAFLERTLAEPFAGTTVAVTHHAPSARSVAPRFQGDALSPAFVSNLDRLVERSGAALWIHGHVHDTFDYVIGKTRVLCNPKGYAGEERERESAPFRWDFSVEI